MAQKLRPQAETLSGSPQPNFIDYQPVPVISKRAPTTADTGYALGQIWDDKVGGNAYILVSVSAGSANWQISAGGSNLTSLTGDTGTAVPSAGNIKIAGTTNQITTAASGSTVTLSIPAVFVAPGSIASTTTMASGTTLTAGTSLSVTTSATVGTSITATLGNITATNGNLVMSTAGNKIIVPTGSNASAGTSGVMSGTPGSVTVGTSACSATALIFYARKTASGTLGNVSISAQDGTGFTLLSTGNETSTFYWWIINA